MHRSRRIWLLPFPLIAGTFGPVALAFSICSLTVPWRVSTPMEGDEEPPIYINNPKWLTGINAAQLTVALISNLFLFLNIAGRVRFSLAQSIVIVGWYTSSISLVALTATVAGPLKLVLPSEQTLTQAYYYAMFSAILYFLVATMMVVTAFGFYKGHYDKEFKSTVRRRELMIQTIGFLLYFLLGAAVFAHTEGWEYLDAVYWADYTILTVGIGDFAPVTHLGRSLLFPFATGGVMIFGLVICNIRKLVIDQGKPKMRAALVEKLRQNVLKKLQGSGRGGALHLAGFYLSQTTSTTDSEWPRKEFELMRQIQDQAITRRRWTSLLISATIVFVFWFVSAGIFKSTEKAQSWSYFESLYFTFTSLLTIGYGDFYPTSSAGKAFFVFWSLLAVPTLTVLIANMGDTIVSKIRGVLSWTGSFIISAVEKRFKTSLKKVAYRVTKRNRSGDDTQEIRSRSLHNICHCIKGLQDSDVRSSEKAAHTISPPIGIEGGVAISELPREGREDRRCLLIKEIGKIIRDFKSGPPKRYTFDDWNWYLKLLEDEAGFDINLTPNRVVEADRESMAIGAAASRSNDTQEEVRAHWSWIGDYSPLIAESGEPEWLLERLLAILERELNVREDLRSK